MKEIDLSYAAGLIDGEGTITLSRQSKNQMKSPAVSMSSTTRELVDFMQECFGGYIVTLSLKKKYKQAYHWQATHNTAIDVIEQITKYLREPEKKRRARLILKQYKAVTPRNGKYTPEMLSARQLFEEEFFKNSTKV